MLALDGRRATLRLGLPDSPLRNRAGPLLRRTYETPLPLCMSGECVQCVPLQRLLRAQRPDGIDRSSAMCWGQRRSSCRHH
jgi:hypothetical protein